MVIRISNRKVLAGFLQALNLSDKTGAISNVIDHAEKVPLETTRENLAKLGLSETEVGQVCDFMFTNGSYSEIENKLADILGDKIEAAKLYQGAQDINKVTNEIDPQDITNKINNL